MKVLWKDFGISILMLVVLLFSYFISVKGYLVPPGLLFVLAAVGIALYIYFNKNKSNALETASVSIVSGIIAFCIYVFLIEPDYLSCSIYLGNGHYGGLMCPGYLLYFNYLWSGLVFLGIILIEGFLINFILSKSKRES